MDDHGFAPQQRNRRHLLGGLLAGAGTLLLGQPAIAQSRAEREARERARGRRERLLGPLRGIASEVINRKDTTLYVKFRAKLGGKLERLAPNERTSFQTGGSISRIDLDFDILVELSNPTIGYPKVVISELGEQLAAASLKEGGQVLARAREDQLITVKRMRDSDDYKEFVITVE